MIFNLDRYKDLDALLKQGELLISALSFACYEDDFKKVLQTPLSPLI
jgi:hypothetical protein